jgi:hypothetical protein
MKFKKRDASGLVVCGSVPVKADLGGQRPYGPGERVSLLPEPKGLHDALHAQVLSMIGEKLKVRALHDFYACPSESLVRLGDEFEVARDEVFIVFV